MPKVWQRIGGVPVLVGGVGASSGADGGFRGTWSALTDYNIGDTVAHNGSTWGAETNPDVGDEPGVDAAWVELSASGGVAAYVQDTEPVAWADDDFWTAPNEDTSSGGYITAVDGTTILTFATDTTFGAAGVNPVEFDTAHTDTLGAADVANNRFVAPADGTYVLLFHWSVRDNDFGSSRGVFARINSVDSPRIGTMEGTTYTRGTCSWTMTLSEGDTVQVVIDMSSSGNMGGLAGSALPCFASLTVTGALNLVGGSGSAAPGWVTALAEASTPDPDDDEFDDGVVDAAWTQVVAGGTLSVAEGNGVLALNAYNGNHAGSAQAQALLKPLSTPLADGDAVETALHSLVTENTGSHYSMFGLTLTDGALTSSNWFSVMGYTTNLGDGVTINARLGTLANLGSVAGGWGNWTQGRLIGSTPLVFLQLFRNDGGGGYGIRISLDGAAWIGLLTSAIGFTPTHAGLYVTTWGDSISLVRGASYEYFRVVRA